MVIMNHSDEQTLINKCKQGDEAAFQELVERYQVLVYNLVCRLTGEAAVAQDILQETLTTAYKKIPRFKPGNFRAWLLRIAVNGSKDYLRSAAHRRQVSLEYLVDGVNHQLQDTGESPEEYSLRQEMSRVIQKALLQLPEEQRSALVLVDMQGLDYQEAANVLKVPAGTLKSRLSRARAAMRQNLAPHMELFPQQFRLKL